MRVPSWWKSVLLAGVAVACGDQPTEVVPERQVTQTPGMTSGGGMIAAATSASDDGLSITTDKDDYAPGDTVWFTGAGWPANDTLDILLEDEPATHEPHSWSVPVGEDGMFRDSTYVVDVGDIGVTFTLTATSRVTSRWLMVVFTDGNIRIQSNREGVTFTVTATKYTSGNCTTGAQPSTSPTIESSSTTFGAVAGESYKFVAAANSDQSPAAPFVNWTTTDPVVSNVGNTLCVTGFNGNRSYTANYDAAPDLTIVKSTSGTFSVGSPDAAYSFQVTNSGNATAEGTGSNRITVTDNLPPGLSAPGASFNPPNWNCTVTGAAATGQTVTCLLAAGQKIAPGASRTFSFLVGVGLTACPSVTNSAGVSGGNEPASKNGNNSSAPVVTGISPGCPNPNQAPTANAGADQEGNEGSAIGLDGSGSTDPDGDTPLEFEWTVVTPLTGFDDGASCNLANAATATPSITCNDDGVVKVRLKVKDSEGLASANEDEVEVTVKNVKPSVTVSPESKTIDEGGSAGFTATVTDVGANDLPADFDFDWTTTVAPCSLSTGATLTSATFSCNDNATGTVKLTVDDDDANGQAFDESSLTVTNVPPTASGLTTNTPVAEGSDIEFSLADVFDPSTVDAASLHYAFDCGDGNGYGTATSYATAGTGNAPECPTTDNGTRTVKGKVFDKDGGSNEYSALVTITNVPPTIESMLTPVSGDPLAETIFVNGTLNLEVTFSDPGSGDTHKAKIKCDAASAYEDVDGTGDDESPFTASCTFTSVGSKTIYVKVTDDDGGYDVETHTILVTFNFEGFFAPVDRPTTYNLSKAGQAIPLKWQLKDANGDPVTNLIAVNIKIGSLSCSSSISEDLVEEYAAGSSGLQNLGNGYYQFNWKTQSNYATLCKSIGLDFGGGYVEYPKAYFHFKK